jgi:hypothetical protein
MGLDQLWLVSSDDSRPDTFASHRKFNALEAFMASEWEAQGHDEVFNVEQLEISTEILDRLYQTIKGNGLNPQSGFFWGSPNKDKWYYEDIKVLRDDVIPKAREYIAEGRTVTYTSWW